MDPSITNIKEAGDGQPPHTVTPAKEPDTTASASFHGVPLGDITIRGDTATTKVIEDFTADLDKYKHQEELALVTMLSARAPRDKPVLQPGAWKYNGKPPNPISIRKARRLLATAYAKIPCEHTEAGIHGYAWIAETPQQWAKRKGTSPIAPPCKPTKAKGADLQGRLDHAELMEEFVFYTHLTQAGVDKLVAWFGKAMFLDLCTDGEIDADATPQGLLGHLEGTYSTTADELEYLEEVTKAYNAPYDPKKPVEEYFMRLQEAQANSVDLSVPYSDVQIMTQALRQFVKLHDRHGRKAANKWNAKGPVDKTWAQFKVYWKKEIHEWSRSGRNPKQAHAVDKLSDEVSSMRADMQALLVENQSYKQHNEELTAQQQQLHYAMQIETSRRRSDDGSTTSTGTLSTITDAMTQMERRLDDKLAAYNASISANSNSNGTNTTDYTNKLKVATNRRPDAYKHINGGRGKQYMFYCANSSCGVNCTHNTDRCYALTKEQKAKYKDATFTNRMGGSEKHLDRFGRFQRDYNFDSL